MRTQLLTLVIAFATAQLSFAQLLYVEDFESYLPGIFSTDHTGATPAQGGWYTYVRKPDPSKPNNNDALPPSANHFEIVMDPNKGKVMKILEDITATRYKNSNGLIERFDLNTYWQQRSPGNNVLKLAFDIYTDVGAARHQSLYVTLHNAKLETLMGFTYVLKSADHYTDHFASIGLSLRQFTRPNGLIPLGITLPAHTWVTVELYLDYDNDKAYFSIPSLNHTVVANTYFPLVLATGGDHDDNPAQLRIVNNIITNTNDTIKGLKIDNINLSAQNFTPTASINEFVSDKFQVFPNPATTVVTINNDKQLEVEEVTIYDSLGRVVKSELFSATSKVELNIENLASGSYFLHIKTTQGTGVKKLIKK